MIKKSLLKKADNRPRGPQGMLTLIIRFGHMRHINVLEMMLALAVWLVPQ